MPRRLVTASLACLGSFWMLSAAAAVNDVFPGDFFPSQPGTTNLSLYLFEREQQGPYVHGQR